MRNFDFNEKYVKSHWKELSLKNSDELKESFNIVHHAIQFLAISGKYLLPPRADDSHTSIEWISKHEVFAGEWIHADKTFRVSLEPKKLLLKLYDYGWNCIDELLMVNKTSGDIYGLLKSKLIKLGADVSKLSFDLHYDIPSHPTDNGGIYLLTDPMQFNEIANYYSNANLILSHLKANIWDSGTVRCWPHHFDLSFPIHIPDKNNNPADVLSVGFAPPDMYCPDPYYFINTTFKKNFNNTSLTKLEHGTWINKEWLGIILPASKILQANNINDQVEILLSFLRAGLKTMHNQVLQV
ncbi:MAG: hypothetical protein JXJ22_07160 [Bacteroidales bacterium]|nr:hypothetical protein [Bacteroidales bacterium]